MLGPRRIFFGGSPQQDWSLWTMRQNQRSQIQPGVIRTGFFGPCWRACHSTRITLSLFLVRIEMTKLETCIAHSQFFQVLEAAHWCWYASICSNGTTVHDATWCEANFSQNLALGATLVILCDIFWEQISEPHGHMAGRHLQGTRSSCGRTQMTRPTLWSTKSSRQLGQLWFGSRMDASIERHFR